MFKAVANVNTEPFPFALKKNRDWNFKIVAIKFDWFAGNQTNNSSPLQECTVTASSQNQFSLEDNCFDTYAESSYLDKCNYYIEVSSEIFSAIF